jgi:hypothetical protein
LKEEGDEKGYLCHYIMKFYESAVLILVRALPMQKYDILACFPSSTINQNHKQNKEKEKSERSSSLSCNLATTKQNTTTKFMTAQVIEIGRLWGC